MSEFERRKEYLIRSLFNDSPDLSTIQEEFYESSTTVSPPLSLESHRSYSLYPPPAHCRGLWSPLPPLTIEIVKTPNKHDEPEEFYKRLHKKILKIYNRIFFEDRSDISDINTSDDDDTQTEPIDYSAKSVELIELTHQSVNDTSNDDNASHNSEPIDYTTSRVELTSQSVNNITADQENHETVTTAATENQRSNEEIEQLDDENRNESHENSDVDINYGYLPNLETILECDEGDLSHLGADKDCSANFEANVEIKGDSLYVESDDGNIPHLEANIGSEEECVSSIADVVPHSTESDGSRDSVTPLSSTVILSRGTSDEEVCMKKNKVSANSTLPKAQSIGRTSPRTSSIFLPKADTTPKEDNANMKMPMEVAVSANATLHFRPEVEEMEASLRHSAGSVPITEANLNEDENMEEDNEDIENFGNPEPHELFPEPDEESPYPHEVPPDPQEDTSDPYDRSLYKGTQGPHKGTPDPHEGTPNEEMVDNALMDTDLENSLQSEVEEMRTPKPHRTTVSPTFHQNKRHQNNSKIAFDKHHASIDSEKYSQEEMPKRPNTIEIPETLDLFDLIRISSPKEGNTKIINPEEFAANLSSEDNSDNIRNIIFSDGEENSREHSLEGNQRKRRSVSLCPSKSKKVRFADKSVQTDDLKTKIVQNIDININSDDKNYMQIDDLHCSRTIVQNIKININPSIV